MTITIWSFILGHAPNFFNWENLCYKDDFSPTIAVPISKYPNIYKKKSHFLKSGSL